MPKGVDQIPMPNDNTVVNDSVLEQIRDQMFAELRLDKDKEIDFLTWIAPAGQKMVRGVYRITPEQACFMLISPHPEKKDQVRTFGMTPLKDYYEAIKEYGHYVGRKHPAKTIFGHLMLQHLKTLGYLTGLTPMDLATYEKNLDTAHWLWEQAQGSRYERGVTTF